MTAVAAPPITEYKRFSPAIQITETPLSPETDELPLNPEERQQLGKALPAQFEFFVHKPFRFRGTLDPKVLTCHFQNLLHFYLPKARLTALPMIGSTVPDALNNELNMSGDIDFFGAIENADSLPEKKLVEHVFLEALRAALEIDAFDSPEPDGSLSTSFYQRRYGNNGFLIKLPKGQNLFKMPDCRLLKGLRCENDAPFYARIPLFSDGKERDLDFTIGWGKDARPNCFTSRDCFSSDFLPHLNGSKEPLRVVALGGYDAQKAWRLLKEGRFYYINEEEAVNLRCGLRGYARTPTRGYRPVKYTSESAFLKKWEIEYGPAGLARFFNELQTYLPLHYHGNSAATVAYLTNLRTLFASHDLPEKEQFLKTFDQESARLLGAPDTDFTFLRTVSFWQNFEDRRLDCSEGIQESRYHLPFPSGYILAHIPWKETAELLSKTPVEIDSQWASIHPFSDAMKLPKSAAHLRKNLAHSLSKLRQDPRASLFQCLLSKDPTPDAFMARFKDAIPHLDRECLACIEKNLAIYHPHLNEIGQILSSLREATRETYLITFLDALLTAKIPMSDEILRPMMKEALSSAKSPPALLMAARMAAAYPRLIDGMSMDLLERAILADPAANGEALFVFLSTGQRLKPETLEKLREAVPLTPPKERWMAFWLQQLDQNLPPPFLVSLIESPHFNREEKIVLTQKILEVARGNYEAYFACWDAAYSHKCLTQDMIPTLVSIAQVVSQNSNLIPWVIERVALMQTMGISTETVRTFFRLITPAWLELPRNSLQCWRILQRATGRQAEQPASLDHATRVSLLKSLFKLEDTRTIWSQMLEIGRNHHQHAKISILQDFIAFGQFIDTNPLFRRFPLNADFPTLFIPLAQEIKPMREVVQHLFDPEYQSIREECLSGLLPHLLPEHFTDKTLEILLAHGPFPTPTRLIDAAIQRRLPILRRELPNLLKRLGAMNITPSIRENSASFFKAHPEFGLPCFQELLDLDIFPPKTAWEIARGRSIPQEHLLEFSHSCVKKEGGPIPEIEEHWKRVLPSCSMPFLTTLLINGALSPEVLWQGAIASKRPPEEMVPFSRQCLEKAGHPIPAIESYWERAADLLRSPPQWPLLQSLHSLPHATEEFEQNMVGAMDRFIGKNGNYAHQLDPREKLLPPLVSTVAELAVKAGKGERALDLLIARVDALQTMSIAKLWTLIGSLGEIERKKGSYQANMERLIQIGLRRLSHGTPKETLQILAETTSRLPASLRPTIEPQFFALYCQEIQKLVSEPVSELWNFFKPILRNDAVPKSFKDISARLLIAKIETIDNPATALRYMNRVLYAIPDQPVPPSSWSLYNGLIEKIGTTAYLEPDAVKIWKRLVKEGVALPIETRDDHLRLERFLTHFVNFTKMGQLLTPDLFVRLAVKIESFESRSGTRILADYLAALNARPISHNVAEMAACSAYWTLANANLNKYTASIWDIAPLLDLHKNALLTSEHKALSFLSLQHSVMARIESLAQTGIKAKTLFEQADITRHIELFHEFFMDFYSWVAGQKDLQSEYLQICELISTGKSEMQIPLTNTRIQYHAMYIHLHMLAAARLIHSEGAKRNMELAGEILDFTIKNPFTIQPQEMVPFLQICADVSLDGDDLCNLLNRVQAFIIHGCQGPSQQIKFVAVPAFLSWLKKNLHSAGLVDTSSRITEYAKARKSVPEDGKVGEADKL